MDSPYQVQALLAQQTQALLGGGERTGAATLLVRGTGVPCTHSPVMNDFTLIAGGKSPKTFIEQVEFLAADLPANFRPAKGVNFTLLVNPQATPINLKFWMGGLLPGGLLYRFMAVDMNYSA